MPKLSEKSRKPFAGRTIKLIDASIIQQAGHKNGRGGRSLRLHLCYNLSAGAMEAVELTDHTVAESVTHFAIEKGVLYIADAGYGKGKQIQHIKKCHADALFRVTPSHLKLAMDEKGHTQINMVDMLNTSADLLDIKCFVHTQKGNYTPVRIIASRLPEDKALLAKQRKLRSASKRQCQIREKTLVYAGWVFLMTTLGDEHSADSLLKMYRARWQVELLFKRIKQALNVTKLRPASLEHAKVTVLMMLILWAITEKQIFAAEALLQKKQLDMSRYSICATSGFFFQHLRATICSIMTLLIDSDNLNNALLRLMNHRSRRVNQFVDLRFIA